MQTFSLRPDGLPLRASNPINAFLHRVYGGSLYISDLAFPFLVLVLLLWHVGQAFVKRLWLLPSHSSRIVALNAGTLALLGIVAPKPKPPNPVQKTDCSTVDEWSMLMSIVFLCAAIGALMPSFAASTDLHDMWSTASLTLHVVLPLHHLLVALIRFSQILSVVVVQKILWRCVSAIRCIIALWYCECFRQSSSMADAIAETTFSTSFASLGVICLEGEDARIVEREFASAARRIVQRHLKIAKKRFNSKQLISLLQSIDHSMFIAGKSKAILETLNQKGTPFVENLCVKHHGDQFGWRLTVLTLLELLAKIEVTTLGKSSMSENAVIAYWQVMDMMQLVDEQFAPCLVCSKDIYESACTSAWSKIQKKKRR